MDETCYDLCQLLPRLQANEGEAWRVLVSVHESELLRSAWRITGNREDAEEVVNGVWAELLGKIHTCTASRGVRGLLFRITACRAIDRSNSNAARRQRERVYSKMKYVGRVADGPEPATDQSEDPAVIAAQSDLDSTCRLLNEARRLLDPASYEVLVLRLEVRMEFDEIAQRLGRSRHAVSGLYRRAVLTLSDHLGDPDTW